MSSLSALLSLTQDALTAQSGAIDIAGQNITNATTPGYVRRAPNLEAVPVGGGQIGGVILKGDMRLVDRFADARVVSESGLQGAADARVSGLAGIEGALAPTSGGIADSLAAFFSAASDVASQPSDPTARTAFLARADETAAAFRDASGALASRKTDLLMSAQSVATEVNQRTSQIATLNQQIASSEAGGVPASDLRDQRDVLVKEVADRTGAQVVEEPGGAITLLSSGTTLVQGGQANSLSASLDAQGALSFSVSSPSGSTTDITSRVTSGQLAGIKQARDVDIPKLSGEVDQFAFDFATKVNQVHAAGVGLDGVGGRNLFVPPATVSGAAAAMAVDPAMIGQPDRVAAATTAAGLPGDNTNAVALGAVGSQPLGSGTSPAARFGALAGDLGVMQQQASDTLSLRNQTVALATTQREQSSGVSVQEEMVNLTKYQSAFQAAQRVLAVADNLLQGLLTQTV